MKAHDAKYLLIVAMFIDTEQAIEDKLTDVLVHFGKTDTKTLAHRAAKEAVALGVSVERFLDYCEGVPFIGRLDI